MHRLPEWMENRRGSIFKRNLRVGLRRVDQLGRGDGLNVKVVPRNRPATLWPILTVELTFGYVPAAERDQGDDADEQDTAADRAADDNQHGQRFWNRERSRGGGVS